MSNDGQDTTPQIPSSSEVGLGVRIDRICEQFEDLLKSGQAPQIETYLPELPEDHRGRLLEELLGLELDYRAKAGDSFTSEEYTLRFPEHASSVAELVVSVRRQQPDEDQTGIAKPRQTPPATKRASDSRTTERSHLSGGPVRIGPYEIIEPCGRGGMGVVYKAWHELFKQYRAIKVLPSDFDEDDISRFSMEIELAGRLNHPNIVRAHEANREQGVLYLVMEFVDGINLDHLIKHHKRLPLGLACEMIRQAAEGLQHAHEHFLVHRDIKPSNLMVNLQGQVKILDFGLARLHAEQNASRLTKHGSVMGTLDFMAPEQWEDPMGATIQADIYSLGCTLYYLVTGTPPYGGEDYSHWLKKQEAHRQLPVPILEHEQGELLQPIINRMMAKSKKERFQTPAEIVEALEGLSDSSELERYAETPVPQLATAGISRTPIPTVNVTNTDLLEGGILGQLAEQFSTDDSEANSKQKTLKPNQSRTDVDSSRPLPPDAEQKPPKPPWYKSRAGQSSLLVLAFVVLFALWTVFRPAQNTALAVQMGALPGLNGGLNGDWWFAEMPWYGPGVRKAFMEALRRGETQIAGVSLEDFDARIREADTESLQEDLQRIVRELKTRLPQRELHFAGRMLENKPTDENFDEELLKLLPEDFLSKSPLDMESLSGRSPTELHAFANILHSVSASNNQLAPNLPTNAEKMYQAAIKAYDEDDPVEQVLLALAHYDYGRFLADRRSYSEGIDHEKLAAGGIPEALLFQISLKCQLADQYRKWKGDSQLALAQIKGTPDSAEELAKKMQLADYHPLRAEMRERVAWINVDRWHLNEATEDFLAATQIRKWNQEHGNTFAWRPMLLNLQGQAMAQHYLGQDTSPRQAGDESDKSPGAIAIYDKLIEEITQTSQGTDAERNERAERLPNIYERLGDAYLFGPTTDPKQAADTYGKAIFASQTQEFENSATLWIHLTRMYYKHAIALLLAGDLEGIQASMRAAENLESKFQALMSQDSNAFDNQRSAFALEQQVARGLRDLEQAKSAPADPEDVNDQLRQLQELIKIEKAQVNRVNIEVLLLVFQKLFEQNHQLAEDDLNILASKLITLTMAMRNGDREIRQQYLKPIFESAWQVIKNPSVQKQLKDAVE